MLQRCSDLDFPEEAIRSEGAGYFRTENLESNLAVVPVVSGEVDTSHAPFPKLPLEGVLVCHGCAQTGEVVWHDAPPGQWACTIGRCPGQGQSTLDGDWLAKLVSDCVGYGCSGLRRPVVAISSPSLRP